MEAEAAENLAAAAAAAARKAPAAVDTMAAVRTPLAAYPRADNRS